jgi:ketosteroid isomerase-like protein
MTNKELIQQVYQDFTKGDVPAVLAAFDANISWTEADGFPITGTHNRSFV